MYSSANKIIDALGRSGEDLIEIFRDDQRVTIAVLYYHVILVDGRIHETELENFRTILSNSLSVSEDELLSFEDKVLEIIKHDKSLQTHLKQLRHLSSKKRYEILDHMRELSVSDNELHEFEINLVSYTAHMLALDDAEEQEMVRKKPD